VQFLLRREPLAHAADVFTKVRTLIKEAIEGDLGSELLGRFLGRALADPIELVVEVALDLEARVAGSGLVGVDLKVLD